MSSSVADLRKLPKNTVIRYAQTNPKRVGSKSQARYERYKSASTIREFLDLNPSHGYADLHHDFHRNHVELSLDSLVAMMHPVLAIAAFGGERAPVVLPKDSLQETRTVASVTAMPKTAPREEGPHTSATRDARDPDCSVYEALVPTSSTRNRVAEDVQTYLCEDAAPGPRVPDATLQTGRAIAQAGARDHRLALLYDIRRQGKCPDMIGSENMVDLVSESISTKLRTLGPYDPATDPLSAYVTTALAEAAPVYSVGTGDAPASAEVHAAALLARYAHRPTQNVVKCLYHFCSYLLDHTDDVLNIVDDGAPMFQSVVDASWANAPATSRSWFGYALVRGGCPFTFRSKLEPCVALSSRDAEAIACVFVVRAMLSTLILLHELGLVDDPALLPLECGVDNRSTIDGTESDKIHRDSRFMAMRLRWLREIVRNGFVTLRYVHARSNVADVFTKLLSAADYARFREMLMNGHLRIDFAPTEVRVPSPRG